MTLHPDRVAIAMKRRAEQVRAAQQLLAEQPPPTTAELLDLATDAIKAALGNDARLPRELIAMRRRRDVERLSREGALSVREIAQAVGLSYSHTLFLRRQLGLGRYRRKRG